jgi:hypothetical protein
MGVVLGPVVIAVEHAAGDPGGLVLQRRRIVRIDDDGGGIDQLPKSQLFRRRQNVPRSGDVAALVFGAPGVVLHARGQVIALVAPFHGPPDHPGIGDVAAEDAQRGALRHFKARRIAHDDVDAPAFAEQAEEQALAEEAGDPREEDGLSHKASLAAGPPLVEPPFSRRAASLRKRPFGAIVSR